MPLPEPAAAPWKWYTSLRGKLTVAFLSIVVLFSLAMLASDAGFQRLRASLDEIHEETLPNVLALQEVGLRVPEFLRTADSVQDVSDANALEKLEADLEEATIGLMGAIQRSGSAGLEGLLRELDEDVGRVLEAKRQEIDASSNAQIAVIRFASAASDLAEQLEGDLIQVRATGGNANSIRDLRAQVLAIVTELRGIPDLPEESLQRVERRYEVARRECIPMLSSLEGERRRDRAAAFLQLFPSGVDPSSLFARRRDSIEAEARVGSAVEAGARTAELLKVQASNSAEESTQAITQSRRGALSEASRARLIEVSLFVMALVLSGLILWLYVRGRIARRMEQLSDDLQRLSEGDLDVEVRGGGDDEMAKLASAAEVFRKNARELEQTLHVLEMRNATLNEFAYVASHDLKSPMRAIANLASWIREDCEDALPDGSREHLGLITERIEKMESLLEDLLRYSRLGNDERITEVIELGSLIRDVVDILALPETVRFELKGGDRTIFTIAAPLQLCLRNLIQNAVHHSDQAEPHVTVQVEGAEDVASSIRIIVEDDGPGIPEAQRPEAFRIFRKLHHGGTGTGMGLALTKRAVELMGGTISIEDGTPRGARFVLVWPTGDPSIAGRAPRRKLLAKQQPMQAGGL
ncbi:MAG: HAMP domain-containing sensor histidine kinase [Planctomycetota bacterium]